MYKKFDELNQWKAEDAFKKAVLVQFPFNESNVIKKKLQKNGKIHLW